MNLSVPGGASKAPISQTYNARDGAFYNAEGLAATIGELYSSAAPDTARSPTSVGAGSYLIIKEGAGSTARDAISLGSAAASVTVGAGVSGYVGSGATDAVSAQYSLTFIGGDEASTVRAGAGSYSIFGGVGGGYFAAGAAGDNSILGGSGRVTIVGGGAGDSLYGGSGGGVIIAGAGNETLGGGGANTRLVGGSGPDDFVVGAGNERVIAGSGIDTIHFAAHVGGSGVTDVISDFGANDIIALSGFDSNAVNYALDTFKSDGSGSGSFMLEDGTKVVLIGVSHISASNFN